LLATIAVGRRPPVLEKSPAAPTNGKGRSHPDNSESDRRLRWDRDEVGRDIGDLLPVEWQLPSILDLCDDTDAVEQPVMLPRTALSAPRTVVVSEMPSSL